MRSKETTLLYLKEEFFNLSRKIDMTKQTLESLISRHNPDNKEQIINQQRHLFELEEYTSAIYKTIDYIENK